MPATVRPFLPRDQPSIITHVLGIQREEFGIPISAEEQPDLRDVAGHYLAHGGNFWVAVDADVVVGTLGLLNIGHGDLTLRKMFVAPSHRGKEFGVAAALLAKALEWSTANGFSRILLGTLDKFKAAQRFYDKAGFVVIPADQLPATFPKMRLDTRFYAIDLPGASDNSDATGWSE